MDRISRIQNPKALHVVQLRWYGLVYCIRSSLSSSSRFTGKEKRRVKKLVGCFDMDAPPEFCFPPSIDARAVFFSFVGLGFVTPISPFFVCDRMDLVFLC